MVHQVEDIFYFKIICSLSDTRDAHLMLSYSYFVVGFCRIERSLRANGFRSTFGKSRWHLHLPFDERF